ncbi:MAG: methyltransferase type 11, partial [Armatimonadetes bacterium CG17_big_fil_post_rev_8_21_14_2_50_66_6]
MEVTRRLKIPRGARVIDIGSGNAPHPRADILCDRDLSGDHERSGPLVRGGRPLVLGEAHRLPFRDRAADYVIASHVVEHATDPLQVVGELQRVGRAGYLECPTPFAEHLLGWRYHRWYVAERDGRLLVAPKTSPDCFAAVFHQLAQSDLQFRAFMLRNPELFFVSLQWVGEVRVERVETIP